MHIPFLYCGKQTATSLLCIFIFVDKSQQAPFCVWLCFVDSFQVHIYCWRFFFYFSSTSTSNYTRYGDWLCHVAGISKSAFFIIRSLPWLTRLLFLFLGNETVLFWIQCELFTQRGLLSNQKNARNPNVNTVY